MKFIALIILVCGLAMAHGSGHGGGHSSGHRSSRSSKCASCKRDSHGKIARSPKAKADFQKTHPCPSTGKTSGGCPGYVIDHVVPLKRGGPDSPANMRWQTKEAAKAKDKIE